MSEQPLDCFHTSLKQYFNAETFSDATVVCKETEFKVHRLILSAQSDFFSKAFTGVWKESTTGRIELEEDDVTAVEAMLRFMYHFDYSNIHGASTMVFNAQVYGLADKYAIPALKSHACETFRAAIVSGWATEDIPSAVAEVYNSTPESDRGLRDQIVEVANANIGKLLETWSFRDMLKETPCFALDMAVSLSGSNENRHQKLESYKCPSCGTIMHGNFADGNYYYCVNCAARYANWTSYVVKS